jgi:PAS domain S-box-containing protein
MLRLRALLALVIGAFTIGRALLIFVVCISAVFAWIIYSSLRDSQRQLDQFALSNSSARAALYASRVNMLIYATVMESRGIYMSTDPGAVRIFGNNLLKLTDEILTVVKNWEQVVDTDDRDRFKEFEERINQFATFRRELVRRGLEIGSPAAREWGDNDANRSVRAALNNDLEVLTQIYETRTTTANHMGILNRNDTLRKSTTAGLALMLLILGALVMARFVINPLTEITEVTVKLANDVYDSDIPFIHRLDEIGKLARAVETFQYTMMWNLSLVQQAHEATKAREAALAQLQHQAQHLTAAADNMTGGLIMLDSSARLVVCNQIYRDMYSLPYDVAKSGSFLLDILKYRVAAGTLPGNPEQYHRSILNRMKTEKPSTQEIELPDGRMIQVNNQPMIDGGWVATHSDITAMRDIEQKLERTEILLATVLENSTDTILVQNVHSAKYLFVNRSAERLFGISRSSMVGKTAKEIFSQETAAIMEKQTLKVVDTKSEAFFSDFDIVTPQQDRRTLQSKRFPICGRDGTMDCIVEVIEDRTAA